MLKLDNMDLPRNSTEKMYEVLHKDVMTMSDTSFVMHEVRCLIEDDVRWNQKLKLLHFYCDWCLHSQIERQGHCDAFIRDLNKTLWQLDEFGQHCPEKNLCIAQFLQIPRLLREMELLLSATFYEKIVPTQTFIFALFSLLQDRPVLPVDSDKGKLHSGSKRYETLRSELRIDTNRPLIKNLVIAEVQDTMIAFECQMDGEETNLRGEITFPVCSEPPFVFENERTKENELAEMLGKVLQMRNMGNLIEADVLLRKMKVIAASIKGMDGVKFNMYMSAMEVGWALRHDISALEDGLSALEHCSDLQTRCNMYHNMATYALQANDYDKADEYVQKCIDSAIYDFLKSAPMMLKGRMLFLQQQYDQALEAYTEAAKYAEQCHQLAVSIFISWGIANTLEALGLIQSAISELTRAEQLCEDLRRLDLRVRTSVLLSQLLIKIGDVDTAIKVIEKVPQYND
jgi:tetratricopeptide (TPR) repeat protein